MNRTQLKALAADIKASADRIANSVNRGEVPHPDDYTLLREDLEKLYTASRPVLVKLQKPAQKRISAKWVGSKLKLAFHGTYDRTVDENTLLKVEGKGEDARATFRDGAGMEWEAYRFNGRWSYGSGAHRLTVVQD